MKEKMPAEDGEEPRKALPPLDFSTLVLSMGSTAMIHLGQVADPDGNKPTPDLAAAKQVIEILTVLEEKTRGNLNDSEENLLRSLLYDLRIAYVDAQK